MRDRLGGEIMTDRVEIRKLPTGIPGLDTVLGGGLPEFSFNLVAGGPGAGKTTLAHQFMFGNASMNQKAVYFTIFGEPAVKMLRYQQQFRFFDSSKINGAIRFVHLGEDMIEGGLTRVLDRIRRELDATASRIVIVDSFRSVVRASSVDQDDKMNLERFVQLLALTLTTYEATTFLIGEYLEQESQSNPVFTVADGIIWLHQTMIRNSVVRRVQVMKMRGQAHVPGLHTVKLSDEGMRIFSRLPPPGDAPNDASPSDRPRARTDAKKTGIRGLDEMLGGGIPTGYSVLVAGPSGSGKTTLATQFILEGAARGEPGIIAVFERRPKQYLKTISRGADVERLIGEDRIQFMHFQPLDLSVDETIEDLHGSVTRVGAKRLVIDSVSGLELALAPSFRDDFRESLYRIMGTLTSLGVTVMLTADVTDSFVELRMGPGGVSFLTDGIILQRCVEIRGSLRKVMAVVKLRGSSHSSELREYTVSEDGIAVASHSLEGYRGLLAGVPVNGGHVAPERKATTAKRSAKKTKNGTRAK
jgi:circadian clock protein KaiC